MWTLIACADRPSSGDGSSVSPTEPTAPPTETSVGGPEETASPETEPEAYVWPAGGWALVGATVVDVDGSRPGTVVVVGDRIDAVLEEVPPSEFPAVDGKGRFVIPGLIDPHVHLFLSSSPIPVGDALADNLRASLYFGVTSVVDAGGPLEPSVHLRDRIASGSVLGPSIQVLGPFLTVAGSHPCEAWNDPDVCWFADDADAARMFADSLATAGADGMKAAVADAAFSPWPTPRLDPAVLAVAVEAVAARGGLRYAHVDTETDALDAVAAGVDTLAHPPFGGPTSADGAAALRAAGVAVHSTIGAFAGVEWLLDGTTPIDDLIAPDDLISGWRALRADPTLVDAAWRAETASWAAEANRSVATLDAAGVPIRPASDAGYWFVPFGWGLHAELAALAALGWSNERLLAAATAENAAAVGWTDRGRIAAGQRADLLVLTADPYLDRAGWAAPERVVIAGTLHERLALRTVDVVVVPARSAVGAPCVADIDCPGAACDAVERVCADACAVAWDPVGASCGPDSACQPADDLDAEPPVCRVVDQVCDPYDPTSCAPERYDEACVPGDLDTFYCYPSGPRVDGEPCSYADLDQMCGPGLFCSWATERCYTYCDPSLGAVQPVCAGSTRCQTQVAAPGAPWFGLCL